METPKSSGVPTTAELAIGLVGLAPPPPVDVPAPTAGPVRWLTDAKRVDSYDLVFPFAIGEVEYRTITVKRLSAGAVGDFTAKLRQLPDDAPNPRYPMFFHGDAEMSDEAWNAMDDDDRFALTEIMADFLPARFRR